MMEQSLIEWIGIFAQTFERPTDLIDPETLELLENCALVGDANEVFLKTLSGHDHFKKVLSRTTEEDAKCVGTVLARYCRMSAVSGIDDSSFKDGRGTPDFAI